MMLKLYEFPYVPLQRRGVLGPTTEVQRITFTEITKAAVLSAMAQVRK